MNQLDPLRRRRTGPETILLRVRGPDRRGLFAGLLKVLAAGKAEVQDVEQVVIRHQLTLSIVAVIPPGQDLLKELLLFGWEQNVTVDFEVVEANPSRHALGHAVTVLGKELTPASLAVVADVVVACGGNISRILRLSRFPIYCYEMVVIGGDPEALRCGLLETAGTHTEFDVAIQKEGISRRAKRVMVLDVDSTLITEEIIDLLATEAGHAETGAALTEQAMRGEMDFETALRERVRLLAGLDEAALDRTWERVHLTPGARTFITTLKRLGFAIAIVSGGFSQLCDRLQHKYDIDYSFANTLEVVDGKLTGELIGEIVDRRRKAEVLLEVAAAEGVHPEQVVAVGDGANDIDMLSAAGLGIAFNAKPRVREAADTTLSVPYLDAILFLLGVRREEVEAEGI